MESCVACGNECESEAIDRADHWVRVYCKAYYTYEISKRAKQIANEDECQKSRLISHLSNACSKKRVLKISYQVGNPPPLVFS